MAKYYLIFFTFSYISACFCLECDYTISGGPQGPGRKCALPFILFGKMYSRCTTAGTGHPDKPWCPTKLSPLGRYDILSTDWGYCDEACPTDNDGVKRDRIVTPKPSYNYKTPSTTTSISSLEVGPRLGDE